MTLVNTLSSASDAKEVRQTEQITLETAIRDRLGEATATPTAETLNHRLQTLLTRFGDSIASPAANTLLARLVSLLSSLGAPADSAASTDTSNASLISLFKRSLATLTSINTSNGNVVTAVNSLSTTTATSPAPVAVPVGATTASLLGAGARKSFTLYNSGTSTVFVDFAATVTATAYAFPLPPGYLYIDELGWTGAVSGIASSGTNTILVKTFNT